MCPGQVKIVDVRFYRCMLKTECVKADDRKHDGPDLEELLEQKEKQSAQWVDNTEKKIFDLKNKVHTKY